MIRENWANKFLLAKFYFRNDNRKLDCRIVWHETLKDYNQSKIYYRNVTWLVIFEFFYRRLREKDIYLLYRSDLIAQST